MSQLTLTQKDLDAYVQRCRDSKPLYDFVWWCPFCKAFHLGWHDKPMRCEKEQEQLRANPVS